MNQVLVKRVEIIVESLHLQQLLGIIERAGAGGYSVVPYVSGKGRRGARTDLGFSDVLKNSMVIVIASAAVTDRIVRDTERLLERSAGMLAVTPVERCIGLHESE